MKMSRMLAVLTALMLSVMWAAPASAQATRTWVSGVGDDANPCSRTAPCKTFAGAISKTAAGGEINALDPGGFGAVTITKSITIDGGPGIAGVLVAGTNGLVVNVGTTDRVVIRHLLIDGLGTGGTTSIDGVNFLAGGQLILQEDNIQGFANTNGTDGACVRFAPSGGSKLFMDHVHCQFNTEGIVVSPGNAGAAGVEVSDSYFQANTDTGLKVFSTGGAANVVVNNSVFAGNTNFGVRASSTSPVLVLVTNSTITNSNTAGVNADQAGTVVVGGNTISRNNVGLSQTAGGTLQSYGDNYVKANVTDTSGTIGSAGAKL